MPQPDYFTKAAILQAERHAQRVAQNADERLEQRIAALEVAVAALSNRR